MSAVRQVNAYRTVRPKTCQRLRIWSFTLLYQPLPVKQQKPATPIKDDGLQVRCGHGGHGERQTTSVGTCRTLVSVVPHGQAGRHPLLPALVGKHSPVPARHGLCAHHPRTRVPARAAVLHGLHGAIQLHHRQDLRRSHHTQTKESCSPCPKPRPCPPSCLT